MCSPAVESQGRLAGWFDMFPPAHLLGFRHLHSQTLDQIKTKLLVLNRSMRSTAKSTTITDPDPSFNDSWDVKLVGWLGFLGRFLMPFVDASSKQPPVFHETTNLRHQYWLWELMLRMRVFSSFVVLLVFCMLFVTIIFLKQVQEYEGLQRLVRWRCLLFCSITSHVVMVWELYPASSYHDLAYIFIYLV